MKKKIGKREINIPDAEIKNFMDCLDISKEEAVEMWLTDNGYEENEEQLELDAKASKARVNKNVIGDKERKPRPQRKEDSEKRELINYLAAHMCLDPQMFENVNVANAEREITFTLGENEYSITLTRHRAKK